jgi:hypothetical protein
VTWLSVMTMEDGTVVEIAMPSPGTRDVTQAYRLRGTVSVVEYATLAEAATQVLERTDALRHPPDAG